MSVSYTWVQWNRHKVIYDAVLAASIVAFIAIFMIVSKAVHPGAHGISDEILILRATGVCAFVMLHIILMIGPLARLSPFFNPLLYNRRHFGVAMCLVATVHAVLVTAFYHGFGVVNPLVSMLTFDGSFTSLEGFPFQVWGLIAFVIILVMAATSHDFWLKNLSPSVWKALHMLVYVAYVLLIAHVVFGVLQSEKAAIYPVLTVMGAVLVVGVHVAAGLRSNSGRADRIDEGWVDAGPVDAIPEKRARVVCPADGGERIAVFKYDGKVSAVSNVCRHQMGPLGEGKIVNGCVTCPWHGYQYRPEDGQSPPPYTEEIETYQVRIKAGRVYVKNEALPPGTAVEPAVIKE